MHSGARGKHGSTPPAEKKLQDWVELKPKEVTDLIVTQANAGKPPAEIGMVLRDQYGVPDVKTLTGKKICQILAEKKLLPDVPRDLLNLIKRSVELRKHLEANRKDRTALRGYQLTVSKIRRLSVYYRRKKVLPSKWYYTPEMAALLVK